MKLSEAARRKRNEYAREYRHKNPDKIREYNVAYWERRAERELRDPSFQAKQLAKQGYSQRQIAEYLKVSVGTVNNLLNKR